MNRSLQVFVLSLISITTLSSRQVCQVPTSDRSDSGSVLRIETKEVMLPVTVRDHSGALVTNLTKDDFQVYEESIPQPVTYFGSRLVPVNVVLLIDTSSSVTRDLEGFKSAALRFAGKLDEVDQISLVRFDDRVELVMDWSKSRPALKRALERLGTGTFTNFHDALWLAAHEQLAQATGKKAIIVLTDGIDSGRGLKSADQALRSLVDAEAAVYVVSKSLIQRNREQRELEFQERNYTPGGSRIKIDELKRSLGALNDGEAWLRVLTEQTGGRLILPDSLDHLDEVYQQVADELRNQYLLFYNPTNPAGDGRYRSIRVKVRESNLHVSSRLGYYPK